MALKQLEGARSGVKRGLSGAGVQSARVRAWLRRWMPRVAILAALLLIARMLAGRTALFSDNVFGNFLRVVSSLLICFTALYYGLKAVRWMKRRLLWRVRRRLVVTYLFVGLTPIVLLALFGLIASFGVSAEAMSRIVAAQNNATDDETARSAQALADAFARLPATTSDEGIKAWLEERAALIRGTLPGARLALWRGANGEDRAALGHKSEAQFVIETNDEATRGVGPDQTPVGAALPGWLAGQDQWHGFSFFQPPNQESFGTPSFRALVRGVAANGRPFALLVVVPVSRALVERYRERTDIYVRPFFGASRLVRRGSQFTFEERREANANQQQDAASEAERERRLVEMFSRDQFGEPLTGAQYFAIYKTNNWITGEPSVQLAYIFNWSWEIAARQFLGQTGRGIPWWDILKVLSIVFLVLELLALVAAAWMTRAVTSSVHKLYRATEYIKRGDFSYRVRVRSHDQLGELAGSFNDMAANIESLLEERVVRERLEREVELAHEVQARLFPSRVPDLLTLGVAAECRAAHGVAGDYYDYVEITPGLVAFALGDVSGKGMSASLVMSNLQATLRAQVAITGERLSIARRAAVAASSTGGTDKLLVQVVGEAEVDGAVSRKVTNINAQLCRSTDANRFATLFLALYEDRTRRLYFTNAGHNAPILVRASGAVERLTTGGMMVGAFEWASYEEGSTDLDAGDVLVIYSDGITEAERAPDEEYGEERLVQLIVEHRSLTADELRRIIFDEIDQWSGQKERGDDQTLVVMKAHD